MSTVDSTEPTASTVNASDTVRTASRRRLAAAPQTLGEGRGSQDVHKHHRAFDLLMHGARGLPQPVDDETRYVRCQNLVHRRGGGFGAVDRGHEASLSEGFRTDDGAMGRARTIPRMMLRPKLRARSPSMFARLQRNARDYAPSSRGAHGHQRRIVPRIRCKRANIDGERALTRSEHHAWNRSRSTHGTIVRSEALA